MNIFNFDKDKNKKIIDPLQRLGISLYHQNLKNSKQVCQMCGEQSAAGEIFNQLWCDDLPLALACPDCISMLQQLIKDTRKYKMNIKRIEKGGEEKE